MADLDDRFRSLSRTGSPDLWPDIETREPRSGLPPTPWAHRVLAAAVALAIAVVGSGLAALTFGGSEQRTATGTSGRVEATGSLTAPTSAEVVRSFAVGQDVRSVAYGEGSVWVAASNDVGSFGGRIVRIDPVTHELQADIPVDVVPTWEVGGGAMVVTEGSLWVTGSLEAPGAFDDPGGGADAGVIRIDATTNEVVQTFELGGTHGADLTFLDGELCVLLFGDESVSNNMEVVRVDRLTGDVRARIPLDTGWAHTIVAADGRLVVLESGSGATNAAGQAAVIDPATNEISRVEVPSDYITPMPVISRGQVWISLDPGFARLDPLTADFLEPAVSLPARFSDCCGFVEGDDRGVWFLSLAANGTDRQLNVIDPSTGDVAELAVLENGAPVAMAVAPDSVWILNYQGTLTHVALG